MSDRESNEAGTSADEAGTSADEAGTSADEAGTSSQEREREVEALAQQADNQADGLKQQSDQLEDEVGAVREDWRRKRADAGIPGAPPPDEDPREQTDRSSASEAPNGDAH